MKSGFDLHDRGVARGFQAFWFPERDPINSPELCQVHRQAACSAYRVGTEGRREALVVKMQEDLTERASKQLQAIAAFEARTFL